MGLVDFVGSVDSVRFGRFGRFVRIGIGVVNDDGCRVVVRVDIWVGVDAGVGFWLGL